MQDWSQTFDQLKEQYLRRSSDRLGKVAEMLAQLSQNPADLNLVKELGRQFHWLAGSGSMYGYPNVSQLGIEGEGHLSEILKSRSKVQPPELEKLKTILHKMVAEFSVPDETPTTTNLENARERRARSDQPDIVIIQESQTDLAALCKLLADNSINYRMANSMTSGVSEMIQQMPDGLIIEIPLPDGDAYDLVDHVRSMPGGDDLAIVIVSKENGFLDRVRSIHCGADAHFEKPIDTKALLRRLRYLLEKGKKEQARILSVEDDPDQASFIRAFLESAGYLVRTCTDPQNFESQISSFNPDLVLLDVMLPGMTGYELARYLRQDERHATLPLIFLTTQGNVEARVESARAGADDHLVKPVAPALLLSSVSARLERARFLKTLLHKDGLTNLLNHSSFMEQAQILVAQQKRHNGLVSLILIDIDYFKSINERHGYPGGDKVLTNLSLLLKKRVRQSDIVGRYGGDDFGILAEGLDAQESLTLASRLLADFSAIPHSTALHAGFYATCSAGISVFDAGKVDLEQAIYLATEALAQAKSAGRNCARVAQASDFTAAPTV